jgi:hypothetical protein
MKITFKHLTKGEITESAIKELTYRGFDCWPENNLAVKGRKFTGRKGKPDIIGFHQRMSGQFMGCEVKTINDIFSADQIIFLNNLLDAGGAAYWATQDKKTGQICVSKWQKQPIPQPKNSQSGSKKTTLK